MTELSCAEKHIEQALFEKYKFGQLVDGRWVTEDGRSGIESLPKPRAGRLSLMSPIRLMGAMPLLVPAVAYAAYIGVGFAREAISKKSW